MWRKVEGMPDQYWVIPGRLITFQPLYWTQKSLGWRISIHLPYSCLGASSIARLCPTHCNPMDCSLPGSSVHGIFQDRTLEWIAFSFSRGSSQPSNQTQASRIAGGFSASWATREAQSPQITTQIRDANHNQWHTYCFFQSLSWRCRLILSLSTEV